jgi:hypothetical protein
MLFVILLGITFVIAFVVSWIVGAAFRNPIDAILDRIMSDGIAKAWSKFIRFAIYLTGISWGVSLWKLEQYITAPQWKDAQIVELTANRWVLEVYRTVIETLQGIAWLLTTFFVIALIAFVVIRVFELRNEQRGPKA